MSERAALPGLLVDANDGVIVTAGIVEGFAGAGAGTATLLVAALTAMMSGAIAIGGTKYTEAAVERDAELALLEDEERRLALEPEEELAELAALYEQKGISAPLARQVANELSAGDALRAHAEVEYGIGADDARVQPIQIALLAGLAFAFGSSLPLLIVLVTPSAARLQVTYAAVLLGLGVVAAIVARASGTNIRRTVARTVVIGALTMLLTIVVGSLVDL